jgi:CheY-like chemotaxis protein
MALKWRFRWNSEDEEIAILKKRCADLERRFANAQISLAVAQEQIESSLQAKDDFTKRVAQHIRAPLHGIIQVCTSIIQDHGVLASTCAKVEIVRLTSSQALSTLNELLQISSTENSRMCMENIAFNPRKLVDAVLKLVNVQVESKHIQIVQLVDGRTPASLAGDMSRLRQALVVVLETLVDAARDSELLEVRVKPLHGDDPLLESMICSSRYVSCLYELCLSPPAGTDHVMVRVGRDPDKEDPQLVAIAGRLELMGWRLLHSLDNRAFQIIVHVKRSLEGSGASRRYSVSRDALLKEQKLTMLLMEENSIFQSTFCEQLGKEGHIVDVVRDDVEVCRLVDDGALHSTYGCVLLDTSVGGRSLLDRIRKHEDLTKCQRMPVVLLVAHGLDDWEARYKEAGIDTYLLKPCTREVLRSRIGDAISASTALVDVEEGSELSLSHESNWSQSELPLKQ